MTLVGCTKLDSRDIEAFAKVLVATDDYVVLVQISEALCNLSVGEENFI